jgi:hypothetical protein
MSSIFFLGWGDVGELTASRKGRSVFGTKHVHTAFFALAAALGFKSGFDDERMLLTADKRV